MVCVYCKRPGNEMANCLKRKAKDAKKSGGGKAEQGQCDPAKGDKKRAFAARMPWGGSRSKNSDGRDDVWVVDSACTHHTATGKGNF